MLFHEKKALDSVMDSTIFKNLVSDPNLYLGSYVLNLVTAVGSFTTAVYRSIRILMDLFFKKVLFQHHTKIADEVDLPQILYNVPSRTASFIEAETVARLSSHKNIIGIKDATGEMNNLEDIKKLCKKEILEESFFLYSGDDATSYQFLKRGGHGTISVSSNIIPNLISEMTSLAMNQEDESKSGEKINQRIEGLNRILFVESNPIPVKYALFLMGIIKLGIRLPLTVLDSKYQEDLKNELKKLDLI